MKPVGTYFVDGVPMDDPAGRWLLEQATPLRPLAAARDVQVAVPGRHGVLPLPATTFEPGGLGMSLVVTDLTSTGAEGGHPQLLDNLDRLNALIGQRHRLLPVVCYDRAVPPGGSPGSGVLVTRRNRATQPIANNPTLSPSSAWVFQPSTGEVVTLTTDAAAGAGPEGRTGYVRATVTTPGAAEPHGWYYNELAGLPGVRGDVRTTSIWVRFSQAVKAALSVAHKSTTMQVRTNQARNPSMETTTAGTVASRTNMVTTPNAALQSGMGWYASRWFGSGGAGTYTRLTDQTDGPVGLTSYIRKAWTTAPGGNGNTGFDHGTTAASPNVTYTGSCYLRTSAAGKTNMCLKMSFRDAGNVVIGTAFISPQVSPQAGAWTRHVITGTAPAGTALIALTSDVDGGTAWAAGDTLDGTGLLLEAEITGLPYFDGTVPPATRFNAAINPDMEGGATTGWGSYFTPSKTVDTAEFHSGTRSLKVVKVSTSQDGVYTNGYMVPGDNLQIGDRLRYSAWVKAPVGVNVKVAFRQDSGTGALGQVLAGNGDWQFVQIEWTLAVVSTATYPYGMIFTFPTGSVAGDTFWVDDVFLDRNPGAVSTPFTGSTPATGGERYGWYGTPNASRSYATDRDLTPAWTGTVNSSTSELRGTLVQDNAGTSGRVAFSSTRWAARGSRSLRIQTIASATSTDSFAQISSAAVAAGKTYLMSGTVHLEAVQTQPTSSARRFWCGSSDGNTIGTPILTAPNVPGTYRVSQVFTFSANVGVITVRVYNGGVRQNGVEDSVWWDEITIEEYDPAAPLPTAGTYFDGDFPDQVWTDFSWTGTPHLSSSKATSPTNVYAGQQVDVPANTWTRLNLTSAAPSDFTGMLAYAWIASALPAAATVDAASVLIEAGPDLLPYFDGNSAAADPYRYAWEGAVNGSPSSQTILGRIAYAHVTATVQPDMQDPYTAVLLWPFTVPGTFWRDPSVAVITSPAFAATWASVLATLTGSSAPITDPRVLAAGPLTSVRLTDDRTGTWVEWKGTLAAGEYVRIDCGALTAFKTNAAAWTGGTDVSGGVSASPGTFALTPQPVDRTVAATVTRAGGTGTVAVETRRAFL